MKQTGISTLGQGDTGGGNLVAESLNGHSIGFALSLVRESAGEAMSLLSVGIR